MGGFANPGSLGSGSNRPALDDGTLARIRTPTPRATPTARAASAGYVANATDPAIEALNLSVRARKAAYALKKAHPSIKFTSGRRTAAEQASAMASNVIKNRKWIEQTYAKSTLSVKCQAWVDKNPDRKSKVEIAAGLAEILKVAKDSDLRMLSKHLSGDAFDVLPVVENAARIKKTIRHLPGLDRFLDIEGGLVRWHAQF